ncbi:MAG TPA: ABC transporter permease [Gemmatimonadaceae bacterium]
MARLWTVVKREYLERVRTKWFIVATVFAPLLFGALMILPTLLATRSTESKNVADIAILDATDIGLGDRVASRLVTVSSTSLPEVRTVAPSAIAQAESLATRQVIAHEHTGYLVLTGGTAAPVAGRYAGRNASSMLDMNRIERSVRQAAMAQRLEREGVDVAIVDSLVTARLDIPAERITDRGRGGSGIIGFIFAFGIAFLLYMSIILYGQNVLRGVMEEKQTRVAEVVMSSVRTDTLLAGKVIGVGAVGLTQLVLWGITSWLLLEVRAPILARFGQPVTPLDLPSIGFGGLLLLLAFFLLGFIFYSALFAAVGAMVNSDQEAQQAAQPVMMLLIAGIIFLNPVLLNPQSTLAQVVSIVPFSAPIIMPLRLSLIAVPTWELAASLAALVAACLAAVWLAARIYRVGMLMYGKRPSMRELVRWVRMAG